MMHIEVLKVCFCVFVLIILALLNYSLYYHKDFETVILVNTNYLPIHIDSNPSIRESVARHHTNNETHHFKMRTLSGNETTHVIREYNSTALYEAGANLEESLRLLPRPTTDATVAVETTESKTKAISSVHVITISKQQLVKQISKSHATNVITRHPPLVGTMHQSSLDTSSHKVSVPKQGYVMAVKIYEQQTMASGNFLQLQCWAKFLNLLVVKPFVYESCLRVPFDDNKQALMVKLEDLFNITDWDTHVTEQGYAPFKEWQQFIREAPRNLIYVQFKYPLISAVRVKKSQGFPFPHPLQGDYYKTGCKFRGLDRANKFLTEKGFKTVRKVCFNFLNGDEPSLDEFSHHLLGGYAPGDVTIIMDEWRGLGESQRVLIRERICIEKNPFREQIRPSLKVVSDAERYRQRYLNGKDYLALIVRFEMTAITQSAHDSTGNDPHYIIPYCIQLTHQIWKTYKTAKNLNTTFLSIDIGKYGSISFERKKYYGHLKEMTDFVSTIYDGKMTVKEWEETFDSVAQMTDPAYIAMLQKVIVTRAKCIIFVGGGSFQRHALHLYQQLHPNPDDQCILSIKKCTSAYRPIQ